MGKMRDKQEAWNYDVVREGDGSTLRINCENWNRLPNIEDNEISMGKTIELLAELGNVNKIIFNQHRDYEYDDEQTGMLLEIALLLKDLVKERNVISFQTLMMGGACHRWANSWYAELRYIVNSLLKNDPLGAYVELKRIFRMESVNAEHSGDANYTACVKNYLSIISYIIGLLDKTRLITIAKPYLEGYVLGDRDVYRRIFHPMIKPDFMFTKLMASYPLDAEELDTYTLKDGTEVVIFKQPDTVQYLYHIMPPEFKLEEEKYELLDMARRIMAEHKPKKSEFIDPERMREVFYNVGRDLLEELANYRNVRLTKDSLNNLTEILVRYTVGFGLIEVLLQDEKIQDISVNSPMGQVRIFVVHSEFDDCVTNIIPTKSEAESWASKLRMISGRPLDEANPVMDTELELPNVNTRVAAITQPLNPRDLAFSFRRHRNRPWTLPLFIKNSMLTPLAAGLISFLVDGTRTMLIAGTRSSGKTSLLSSILVEIMRRYRIITIEDTLELPTSSLRKLGFNIQPLKVASALSKGTSEVSASDGIRTTLRMGDSSLIIGEVRSHEAVALYEAMRVGAAANVVAGTIHGDSPYGVFDRVVNDIGVPRTSFKATDIIIVANPIRSADGLHKFRRVTRITEIGKEWKEDPHLENGFLDLMKYDAKKDSLDPTDGLISGDSEILKTIAGNVKEFAGNWDAVWENIQLRAKIKQTIVDTAVKIGDDEMLEAPFVILCNDMFHLKSDAVKEEVGSFDPKRILYDWNEWFRRAVKKRQKG